MIFGMFLTTLSAIYSLILLVTATDHPITYAGRSGMYANLRGNGLFTPFLVADALVLVGILICLCEAYRKPKT
jgi:hypothetical protein